MKTKQWKATDEDAELIKQIADRALEYFPSSAKPDVIMTLKACHLNGTPLRLKELLNADNFNFSHDIAGISQHLNTKTGKLENCFLPRFAQ